MTPLDINHVQAVFRNFWPRAKWTAEEWALLAERSKHIDIDSEQAEAAVRNYKATTEKYPTVAAILKSLHGAEVRKVRTAEGAAPLKGYVRPETLKELDEHGFTSFERRVIDDPRFRPFARKCGRLNDARETEIFSRAIGRGLSIAEGS